MKVKTFVGLSLMITCVCRCQSSSLVVDVVELRFDDSYTFVCNVPPSTNLTRWTYLSDSTETSLMSYQNGRCSVSPSDSFLSNSSRYSYICNSTAYQVTVKPYIYISRNNDLWACKDARQLDSIDFTWIIKTKTADGSCSYCQPTISFDVVEVTEGDNATFVCSVPSNVSYVNWNRNIGVSTAAMAVNKTSGQCITQGTTFLDNTSKYIYTCINTVYQVTLLNVQRSEHNDMYLCTPVRQTEGTESNWIMKVVKAPVTSVTITTPPNYIVNVTENAVVEFTCITSTAKPAASISWYRHPYGEDHNETQVADNVTTTTDFNDLSVTTSILRLFVTRQYNDTNVLCRAINAVNTTMVRSTVSKLMNVIYKADNPFIHDEKEYRVIENTLGTLDCTVNSGNPTPTLYWECNDVSITNNSTINSNRTITTLVWTPLRTHDGTCSCTSKQTYFQDETVDVTLVVLYSPSKPTLKVNDSSIDRNASFIEGTSPSIKCTSESSPSPDRYIWTGPKIVNDTTIETLSFNNVTKNHAGEYKCSVHNTMYPSNGGTVSGINSSTVNIDVLYPPVVAPMGNIKKYEGEELIVSCSYTYGMPVQTSVLWTRDIDNLQWGGEHLYISSIKRNDAGYYYCNASNVMKPSGDSNSYIGHSARRFFLYVLYEASITAFMIEGYTQKAVTVNESDHVRFICNADSNPTATMTLSHDLKTLTTKTTNILEYSITEASCLDAGLYVCNAYNGESTPFDVLQLLVKCYPRAAKYVNRNKKTDINSSITIVFDVIAYPPPTFKWYQLVNGTWTLLTENDKYRMSSSAAQSNLTIHSVSTNDFTSYKVIAENEFGNMEQEFSLSPYEVDSSDSFTSSGPLIGGIIGGTIGIVVLVALGIIVLRRHGYLNACSTILERRKSQENEINKPAEDSAYDNIDCVPEYEMIDQSSGESVPYSSLGQTQQSESSDNQNGGKKDVYENLKVEVF